MNSKKKALIVTTVASTIDQFCMNDIKVLQQSFDVSVMANFQTGNNTSKERMKEFEKELKNKDINFQHINLSRTPFSKCNFSVYREIKEELEKNYYDVIHCHTPIAAMNIRLAAKETRKKGSKVIYTAHGFHFFKGAPIKNWLLYYPIEKYLSKYTDMLITINREDYNRAKGSFKSGKIEYIPGVGIDIEKFSEIIVDKTEKRNELGLPNDAFVVLSVGELNDNKNHETIIKAIAKLNNQDIYYVICGQGILAEYLNELIKEVGLENQVKLLGYRCDIAEIYKIADIFAFPSKREGLGLAAIEAMAAGLPIITSNIHGILDYSIDGETGYICNPTDVNGFAEAIERLSSSNEFRARASQKNKEIAKKFDVERSINEMIRIYKEVLADG